MKLLAAILYVAGVALSPAALGMNSPKAVPSPISVLKYNWRFEPALMPEMPSNLMPSDPHMMDRAWPLRFWTTGPPVLPPKGRDLFRYTLKLRNDSEKQIQKVLWNYLFLDPASREVVSIIQIDSKVKISPKKTKKLDAFTTVPPTNTINVNALRTGSEKFERVVILQIQYTDGTVWNRQ